MQIQIGMLELTLLTLKFPKHPPPLNSGEDDEDQVLLRHLPLSSMIASALATPSPSTTMYLL